MEKRRKTMKDRYLFKGKIKAKNTGHEELDWVIGNLVVEQSTGRHYIVDLSHFEADTKIQDVLIEVDPSTVCQCTGYEGVFEHDIFDCEYMICEIVWSETWFQWMVEPVSEDALPLIEFSQEEIDVTGNSIDNPELLE